MKQTISQAPTSEFLSTERRRRRNSEKEMLVQPKQQTPGLWSVKVLGILMFAAGGFSALGAEANSAGSTNDTKVSNPLTDLFPDIVVARGKGFEIKRSELDSALVRYKADAVARGQVVPIEAMAALEPQVLDFLIQVKILLSKATDQDRTQGRQEAVKLLTTTLARGGGEEVLARQLRMVGMTMDQFRAQKVDEATAKLVLQREIQVTIADEEIKKYYTDNPGPFERPEMVRAAHILLATRDLSAGLELSDSQKAAKRKQLEDILKRARNGEDFTKLSVDYSEETVPALRNKEYTVARGQMPAEFELVAFSLRTNSVSDVITTPGGYYIIKVYEKIPAKQESLEKVSPDIKDYLRQQAIQKQLPAYMAKARKEAGIEIPEEKLRLPPEAQTMSPGSDAKK